jgi:hypothetical protein
MQMMRAAGADTWRRFCFGMGRETKPGTRFAEAAVVVMDQPARNVAVGNGWVLERDITDVSYSQAIRCDGEVDASGG